MGVGGGGDEGEIGLESGYSYSCESGADTLRWIEAIVEFLRGFPTLTEAHLVNFFKDRLWEALDPHWIRCLANDPLHNLLRIPSGLIQARPTLVSSRLVSSRLVLSFNNFLLVIAGSLACVAQKLPSYFEVSAVSSPPPTTATATATPDGIYINDVLCFPTTTSTDSCFVIVKIRSDKSQEMELELDFEFMCGRYFLASPYLHLTAFSAKA